MKNKEDDSKVKSDEYLAFEALAKRIITTNKKELNKKVVSVNKKTAKTKEKPSKP